MATGVVAAATARATPSTPRPPHGRARRPGESHPEVRGRHHGDDPADQDRPLHRTQAKTSAVITLKSLLVTAPADLREHLAGRQREAFRADPREALPGAGSRDPRARHDPRLPHPRPRTDPSERPGHRRRHRSRGAHSLRRQPRSSPLRGCLAKLCGTSPVPASSSRTNRHRLSRAGHREANAALCRAVIVRMRFHEPTIKYVARRTAEACPNATSFAA